jgi:hypothetical protein
MDIYTTATLNRLVQSLIRPQTALLSAFFGEVETSDTETIFFDVTNKKRRISPFVSPLKEGRLVSDEGYVTKTFRPAYIKDKRVFDPNKALKRMAGETIGGSMSPADRAQANLVIASADQLDMLMRRKEIMAAEVLRTGKCVISGDGYPSVEVDFGRDSSHTVTLTSTARWGESGVDPLKDVKNWALNSVMKRSGAKVTDVIMDAEAAQLFVDSASVANYLSTRPSSADPDQLRSNVFLDMGLNFIGRIGGVNFWIYADWYVNEAGTEVPILPSNTVILASAGIEGVQHQGAIKDEASGLQPLEFFSKSWAQEDPSVRYLLMQSAPLVVPYRPNASFCATVR